MWGEQTLAKMILEDEFHGCLCSGTFAKDSRHTFRHTLVWS